MSSTCPHLEPCGSCPLLPLPYEEQLARKQAHLLGELEGLAYLISQPPQDLLAPPVAAPQALGYRHSVKLVVAPSSQGEPLIGLYRPGTHSVIDTAGCPVQAPLLNLLLDELRTLLRTPHAPSLYHEATRAGALRYVVARSSWSHEGGSSHVHLTLISAQEEREALSWLALALKERLPWLTGVALHINASGGNAIFDWSSRPLMRPLWGEAHLTSHINTSPPPSLGRSLTLKASAESFSQVNPAAASLAYRAVVEALEPHEGLRALDLYCGVGSISLALAQAGFKGVVGLEESPSSVRDAQDNALTNGLEAHFEAGLTEALLPAWVDRLCDELPLVSAEEGAPARRAAVVSLNPSRRGCQASVLDELARLSPQRLAYMSCHPRSLMRDLKRLAKRGYQPTRLQLFDLFPGTPHYEVVCALS